MRGLLKRKPKAENRIENLGRWPLRMTTFRLQGNYEFVPGNFPEIYFVEAGDFLHDTANSTQALQEGAIIVSHPGHRHAIRQGVGVVITRLRFLPEWLVPEYELIAHAPATLGLFFDQSWLRYRRAENWQVFKTDDTTKLRVRAEVVYLTEILRQQKERLPTARIALLKLMDVLAGEHDRFWRGRTDFVILASTRHVMDQVETYLRRQIPFDFATMPRLDFEKAVLQSEFLENTGLSIEDYAKRRRIFHAAAQLISTPAETRHVLREFGYDSSATFSAEFVTVFGVSPQVYRDTYGYTAAPPEAKEGEGA
jgi:AraC-like DNA-binding protein